MECTAQLNALHHGTHCPIERTARWPTAPADAGKGNEMEPQHGSPLGGGFLADPGPVLARFREQCPVARTVSPSGRTVWLVTREEDVRAGLLDPRLSLRGAPPDPQRPRRAMDMTLVNYDPPDHTRIRRLAAPALAPARVAPLRPAVGALAADCLDAVAGRGRVELLAEVAAPFAFGVLCEALGIAGPDRAALRSAVDLLADTRGHTPAEKDAAVAALDAYVRRFAADALATDAPRVPLAGCPVHRGGGTGAEDRAAAPAGVFAEIVRAWAASSGRGAGAAEVSHAELLDLLGMLLLAGYDSTVQAVGMAVLALLGQPGSLAALAADPDAVPGAVDELLRMDTPGPFATTRRALADVEIGGTVIPAGSAVLLSVAAANHDPRAHPDPDRLRLDRPTRARQLSFGAGPHYCLGAALARMSLTALVAALAARWPGLRLAVEPAALRWGGGFQHRRLLELPVEPGLPAAGTTVRQSSSAAGLPDTALSDTTVPDAAAASARAWAR